MSSTRFSASAAVQPIEAPMHRPLRSILTPEDRATYAKWMRVVAIVYGAVLLLLVALIATQRIVPEPTAETTVATAPVKTASPGRN